MQVKNNINRFPDDFMFQMTKDEMRDLRSKFSTANINSKSRLLPHVFTEQGIYMLATVLNGEIAEKQSIFIGGTGDGSLFPNWTSCTKIYVRKFVNNHL